MITLHKLIDPENKTVFVDHPELNDIWEVPALQQHARASYERYGSSPEEDNGEVLSINENYRPIGITGWFSDDDLFPDILRLRYYGIVPSKRGKGYGEQSMRLLLERLSMIAPPQYIWLAESVSVGRTVAPQIIGHFKKMGFEEFEDDPAYGQNANCGPVMSLKVRLPGR